MLSEFALLLSLRYLFVPPRFSEPSECSNQSVRPTFLGSCRRQSVRGEHSHRIASTEIEFSHHVARPIRAQALCNQNGPMGRKMNHVNSDGKSLRASGTTMHFVALGAPRVKDALGVSHEANRPQPGVSQMLILQLLVRTRSSHPPSAVVLFPTGLQEGQQVSQPEILARQTGESRLLAGTARSATSP